MAKSKKKVAKAKVQPKQKKMTYAQLKAALEASEQFRNQALEQNTNLQAELTQTNGALDKMREQNVSLVAALKDGVKAMRDALPLIENFKAQIANGYAASGGTTQ